MPPWTSLRAPRGRRLDEQGLDRRALMRDLAAGVVDVVARQFERVQPSTCPPSCAPPAAAKPLSLRASTAIQRVVD